MNHRMRKSFWVGAAVIPAIAIAVYLITWIVIKHRSQPLHGPFDVDMKCMGGHEIFLDLESSEAYEVCPGHRTRDPIGKVVRNNNSATILDNRDGAPWIRIDWDGSSHSLSFLKTPDSTSLMGMIPVRSHVHQVTSPWRLWAPRFFPEE